MTCGCAAILTHPRVAEYVRFKAQFVQLAGCETGKITEAAFVPHAMQKWKALQLAEDIWHQEFQNSDVVSPRNPKPTVHLLALSPAPKPRCMLLLATPRNASY